MVFFFLIKRGYMLLGGHFDVAAAQQGNVAFALLWSDFGCGHQNGRVRHQISFSLRTNGRRWASAEHGVFNHSGKILGGSLFFVFIVSMLSISSTRRGILRTPLPMRISCRTILRRRKWRACVAIFARHFRVHSMLLSVWKSSTKLQLFRRSEWLFSRGQARPLTRAAIRLPSRWGRQRNKKWFARRPR